jgi:hypothetical protein
MKGSPHGPPAWSQRSRPTPRGFALSPERRRSPRCASRPPPEIIVEITLHIAWASTPCAEENHHVRIGVSVGFFLFCLGWVRALSGVNDGWLDPSGVESMSH